eukprot:12881222-Prorocentrum_lima.AAC.1
MHSTKWTEACHMGMISADAREKKGTTVSPAGPTCLQSPFEEFDQPPASSTASSPCASPLMALAVPS